MDLKVSIFFSVISRTVPLSLLKNSLVFVTSGLNVLSRLSQSEESLGFFFLRTSTEGCQFWGLIYILLSEPYVSSQATTT